MFMVKEEAKRKVKVVEFFKEYGLKATIDAFGVSKSSIYNWLKKLKDSGGKLEVLNDNSKAPVNKRKKIRDKRVVAFIKQLRHDRPYLGKEKLKVFLDKYCLEHNIKTVSSSTIGRIIKENNLFFTPQKITHFGKVKQIKRRKKLRRKGYKPQQAGDLVQVDSITLFTNGIKRYIITAVDLISKFAFAYCYLSLSSDKAYDFAKKFKEVAPFKIRRVQSDNGLEFHKYFQHYLAKEKITHFFNWPRHPQSNAVVERFNRTIQEEFVYWNENLLDDNIAFNNKLMEYLMFYNIQRGHKSLSYQSPLKYLINHYGFSNMLWTRT
jgi:transposase InsO family protein